MKPVAAGFALLLAASGCSQPAGRGTSSPAPVPTSSPVPVTITSVGNRKAGVTFALQRNGRRVYSIAAAANLSKRIGEGTGRSVFKNPPVIFYDRDGTTLSADAPAATVAEADRSIVMSGGVKARTGSGIKLSCSTLTYDDRTQRLLGQGDVVMTTPRGERLEGQRVDADVRLSQVRVTGTPLR
jgi:hypothetical protein